MGAWKYQAQSADRGSAGTKYWQEPTSGHATRRPGHRNNTTARGFTPFNDVVVYHESELEHRVSTLLQARTDVDELHSQFPVMAYLDADNVQRAHTFDYFVVLRSGRRVAITVKQFKKRAKMHLLLEQVRQSGMLVRNAHNEFRSGFVDDLALITDVDANMDAFLNASDILRARDFYNREDHVELLDQVQHFPGRFRFGELFRNCTNQARRWTAAWALIEYRNIRPFQPGRISDVSWMTVVR